MKIGLVLDDGLDRNDGVQQYVKSLGAWLSSQGHFVHYLVGQTKTDDKSIHSLSRNVGVRFNRNRLSVPLPANKQAIKELLAQQKFDILHVQMPYSPFMAGKVIKYALPSTAVVGTFHVVPYGRVQTHGSRVLGQLQKLSLKRFDAICSVSTAAEAFAMAQFGIRSSIMPNMINLDKFTSKAVEKPGRIVFLGRLVPRKGCDRLLQAITQLPASLQAKTEVIIAGDGPDRPKLEKFVKKHDLTNVHFLGYIDEIAKSDLLASAQLAVFPALGGESFGIVLIEAMAAGAGVVLGGDNIGYRSVLAQWPQTIFNPRDTKGFSKRLELFLMDDKLRVSIHAEQQNAVKRYDTSVVGADIIKLYNKALLHRRADVS